MDVWVEAGGDGGSRTLTSERAFDGQQELPFGLWTPGWQPGASAASATPPQARS